MKNYSELFWIFTISQLLTWPSTLLVSSALPLQLCFSLLLYWGHFLKYMYICYYSYHAVHYIPRTNLFWPPSGILTTPHLPPLAIIHLFSVSMSSGFVCLFVVLDSTYKWDHTALVLISLICLSTMPSRPIHAIAHGRISFLFMAEKYSLVYLSTYSLSIHPLMGT